MRPVIAITGAYGGLGSATARLLALSGYDLLLGGRNTSKLKALSSSIRANHDIRIHTKHLDVTNNRSVMNFFRTISPDALMGVVHTAGALGSIGPVSRTSSSQWQKAIEINLLGTYRVLRYGLPAMSQSIGSNFIVLSGGGASGPLPTMSSYASSKVAIVRLVETVSHEIAGTGVGVYCVAPGILDTEMNRDLLRKQSENLDHRYAQKIRESLSAGQANISNATELIRFLLENKDSRLHGRLISAQWDDWRNWKPLPGNFDSVDLYTLRRIVDV